MTQRGISLAEYNRLLTLQGGKCAICRRGDSNHRTGRAFSVDHDHATDVVRGLLCHTCNLAVGAMHDNPEHLRSAADYLERGRSGAHAILRKVD